jgi:hypothetical protein
MRILETKVDLPRGRIQQTSHEKIDISTHQTLRSIVFAAAQEFVIVGWFVIGDWSALNFINQFAEAADQF